MDKLDLKNLAKELNLSASTVSRALRGSHEISRETKEQLGFGITPGIFVMIFLL